MRCLTLRIGHTLRTPTRHAVYRAEPQQHHRAARALSPTPGLDGAAAGVPGARAAWLPTAAPFGAPTAPDRGQRAKSAHPPAERAFAATSITWLPAEASM